MESSLVLSLQHPLLVSVGWYVWRRISTQRVESKFSAEHGCKPLKPWSAKWPLGLDLLIRVFCKARAERVLSMFEEIVNESGTTFEQSLLGVKGIDTIDPENIEAILSTDFANYTLGLRPVHSKPLLGSGIFTQDGAAWKQSRQLLRPHFAFNRQQNFNHIQRCVQDIVDRVPEDGTVDLQPLFFKLTFDTTVFLLFGDAVKARDWGKVAGQEKKFSSAFNTGQDYLASRGRLGDLYWLINDKAFRDACRICHEFVDEAVKEALEEREKEDEEKESYAFIKSLVQQTRDPQVLRDQCLNVLLAGRDTTGSCLTWSFRLLSHHPEVLDKLRSEIKEHSGIGSDAEPPTREALKKMTYLGLVIKEVLRLYPSVPVNSRSAIEMTTLPVGGGPDGRSPILVRPGEAVGYCPYVMHRHKDLYGEDAEEFRPERWEGDNLRGIGWGYVPFNGGPRICPFQWRSSHMSWSVAESENMTRVGGEKQTLTLVVSSAEGCKVELSAK